MSQALISSDLANLSGTNKLKHRKTTTNPKGAGRPKGTTKPKQPKGTRRGEAEKFVRASDIVRPLINSNQPLKLRDLELEHGISRDTFERAALAEQAAKKALADPPIDPATLSQTAQQKLSSALKHEMRKLEAELRQKLNDEYQKWLADLLVGYREKERHYNIVVSQRKGFMKRSLFARFRFALHPDTYNNVDTAERNELVAAWEKLKIIMLDEKEAPATGKDLPKTMEELLKRKAEYQAQRAQQRAKRKTNEGVPAR